MKQMLGRNRCSQLLFLLSDLYTAIMGAVLVLSSLDQFRYFKTSCDKITVKDLTSIGLYLLTI